MGTDETSEFKKIVEELEKKRAEVKKMGGEAAIEKQHKAGKLTARERVDLLFDPGTFEEVGIFAHHQSSHPDMIHRKTPADGVITGYGNIDGRKACVTAYDFTVMAGSMGIVGEKKVTRMRETALTQRIPMIWLLDSAGARIQEKASSEFAGAGDLFYEEVIMSGVVPQVAAVLGPCAAGTAYIPGLADFVPMVKGTSSMALGGPPLVKAVTGEDTTPEEMGGSKVHCEVSGVGDLQVEDDEECIKVVRDYLSFFPSHNKQKPPIKATDDPHDRRDEELLKVLPENQRRPYDMKNIINIIVDDGHTLEIKPKFAKNIITTLARMGGRPVGIVASQPKSQGGVLTVDTADKAARFINLCDAFGIPLLFMQDVPGFMVGTVVEKQGIIRHGAKMLYAVSEATVPKITVVIRKAYGAGYFVMCGTGYKPDHIVAWPTAEISLMGADGAVNIIFRKKIAAAEEPDKTRAELVERYKKEIDPMIAARGAHIDDIIDPRDTRRVVIAALERTENKQMPRPWKKHGVVPV